MHWTERRSAITRIGEELRRRGWTIHGYTEDRSNMMVDYYAPASWDGIATHPDRPGIVVCVDVRTFTQERYRGQDDDHPLVCHATPKGKTWHVELDGQVIKRGVGLRGCADWDQVLEGGKETAQRAVWQLVSQIETAVVNWSGSGAFGEAAAAVLDSENGDEGYQVEHDRDWTWLRFADKPPESIREILKSRLGARWSRKRQAWYVKQHVDADVIAHVLQGV